MLPAVNLKELGYMCICYVLELGKAEQIGDKSELDQKQWGTAERNQNRG
jgi:hypothetical protein